MLGSARSASLYVWWIGTGLIGGGVGRRGGWLIRPVTGMNAECGVGSRACRDVRVGKIGGLCGVGVGSRGCAFLCVLDDLLLPMDLVVFVLASGGRGRWYLARTVSVRTLPSKLSRILINRRLNMS